MLRCLSLTLLLDLLYYKPIRILGREVRQIILMYELNCDALLLTLANKKTPFLEKVFVLANL